jgi:hypothetical protein
MTDFKVNDLVVIVCDPKSTDINSHIRMQGMCGYIEEIVGEYAQFQELREGGEMGGAGGVKLAHLVLVNDDKRLQALKQAKDERFNKLLKESQERTKRYNSKLEEAARNASDETGVSMRSVLKIFKLHDDFLQDWEENDFTRS